MSTSFEVQPPKPVWELPPVLPLNQVMWDAWEAKGIAEERRSNAALFKASLWASVAALLAAAVIWSHLAPYDVVVRFIVSIAALGITVRSLRTRRYSTAVTFAALVLLYNPALPVFAFAGDWQRAFVVASAVPFVALLARSPAGAKRHV